MSAKLDDETKSKIWEILKITVEERYDPGMVLNSDFNDVRALLSQVNAKVDELAASRA